MLGMYYFDNDWLEDSERQAFFWLLEAARQEHPGAIHRIGDLYAEGRGVEKDPETAKDWYQRAAKFGYREGKSFVVSGRRPITWHAFWEALAISFVIAAITSFAPYFLPFGRGSFLNNTWPILCFLPFLQSVLVGYRLGKWRTGGDLYTLAVFLIFAMDIAAAFLLLGEGIFCLAIFSPLLFVIIIPGIMMGAAAGKESVSTKRLHSTLIPLAFVFSLLDANSARPVTNYEVRDAVVVQAPANILWNYIVEYPVNNAAPDYFLWKVGLPMPTQSTASGAAVGQSRECKFTKDIVFKEKITALDKGKVLEFDITAQPEHPELMGHFQLDKGKLELIPNKDGTTTLVSTSWYRLFVSPAFYFNWWAEDIVREVHFRVMGHMKNLAEAEYAAKKHD